MKFSIFCLLPCFVACTNLSITEKNGNVRIEKSFGFVSINMPESSDMVSAKIKSFGVVSSPVGISVGYNSQVIFYSDGSCRLFLVIDDGVDIQRLKIELQQVNSICFIE